MTELLQTGCKCFGGPQNLVAKSPIYITQNPPIVVCIMCFFKKCLRACSSILSNLVCKKMSDHLCKAG